MHYVSFDKRGLEGTVTNKYQEAWNQIAEDQLIIIGYWLDMEIYVRVLVRSNIARR